MYFKDSGAAPGPFLSYTLFAQALYYLVSGLWPLVHMASFLAVTGPKTDLWLVRTVALLITVIGSSMLIAALARRVSHEIIVLAMGSIVSFTLVDVFGVLLAGISPIYLLDAAAEIVLLGFWYLGWKSDRAAGNPAQGGSPVT